MSTELPIDGLSGILTGTAGTYNCAVVMARASSLFVRFARGLPAHGAEFESLDLRSDERTLRLGRCRFEQPEPRPSRRRDDPPPEPGDGRLLFLDQVYDFSALGKARRVVDLRQKIEQLPLLFGRREHIKPSFREHVAALVYDMQVYRTVFDEIDRDLCGEPPRVRALVEATAMRTEYPRFRTFYDEKTRELEREVRDFAKQEHEQHGFYFRKHLWDLILASPFLARTNLKPRGYSGDSMIMRMIYEEAHAGATTFARFMHRYPLSVPAAQAVRNRRTMLAAALRARLDAATPGDRVRVLSVACGPATELADMLLGPADAERVELVLLDQDPLALADARATIARLETDLGVPVPARFVEESVRTMLRLPRLGELLGQFDFVYSMGLFDYLTPPVARAVIARLYDLLLPGGELRVGNFHPANRSRIYMEYWADWVLFYRDAQELMDLARDLDGAESSCAFEDTQCQMFLRVRRQ